MLGSLAPPPALCRWRAALYRGLLLAAREEMPILIGSRAPPGTAREGEACTCRVEITDSSAAHLSLSPRRERLPRDVHSRVPSSSLSTMKAQAGESAMSSLPPIRSGKVSKAREDDPEVTFYLDKLRHLLPAANTRKPLEKKLNRLEVIESVIQYISELQDVLQIDVHDREMDLLEYETKSITLAA